MPAKFNPTKNNKLSKKLIDYSPRKETSKSKYQELGFMCGLEVHQQLKTDEKLFCRCPVGLYQDFDDFDAEIIRHMRPTLSELGEYDGTALMEFKTRKEITYRIKNQTTCTYEIDDTPPFPINREALKIAMEVSLLLKQNIVGELHITRKQYLDGSIPAGFQRTAIVGIEGEIPLSNKNVKIIQLSIEEDSCREVSDYRHKRVYTTDRLGIPLIETVTYPELLTPDEAQEAAHFIRFLARSTGKVRTGIGAAREDVNVSVRGGTRVEIKGVAHISWIPELTHNEAFRQKALLTIKDKLNDTVSDSDKWSISHKEIELDSSTIHYEPLQHAFDSKWKIIAVNLPDFKGILSFFTQPGKIFADEIIDRLKVIACLERPNMIHSEELKPVIKASKFDKIKEVLNAKENDAQVIFWASEEDIKTALETIEERCQMAFHGVPNETRKSFSDGTTIFERVLPGADRMYPDTDSAPISIKESLIESIREQLPVELPIRLEQLKSWKAPIDVYPYILKNNLMPLIEKTSKDYKIDPAFLTCLLGHRLKNLEGTIEPSVPFDYQVIPNLINFIKDKDLDLEIIFEMLPIVYKDPNLEFESVLNMLEFKKTELNQVISNVESLRQMYSKIKNNENPESEIKWIMGNLRSIAIGNIHMEELRKVIVEKFFK